MDNTKSPTALGEAWRPVTDGNGEKTGYEVSSMGRVRSMHKGHMGKILKGGEGPMSTKAEPRTVWMIPLNSTRSIRPRVDKLVAKAFLDPAPLGARLVHLNGRVWDDRAENLKWESPELPSVLPAAPIVERLGTEQLRVLEKRAWEEAQEATQRAIKATRARAVAEAVEEAQRGAQG